MAGEMDRTSVRSVGPFRWLTRQLSRVRLTVWLLIIMGVTMVVGSIFPQGYDADTYVSSWGEARYEALSKFGLLNLFHTKYFIILGLVLLLNLVFCSVLRWVQRSGAGLATSDAPDYARVVNIKGTDAMEGAKEALKKRGFKILGSAGGIITARRGPWPEGVSLLYHLAMAIAIIGFIMSALFSFEGDATLYPGEAVRVPTVNAETGFYKMFPSKVDTLAWADRYVELTLNEFVTEWELYEDRYYPKDWLSDVNITTPGSDAVNKRIVEVNRPLRVAGLTFYQMAYEQEFDIVVWKDGAEIERAHTQAYAPFTLDSIGGTFFPANLRVGTLYEKYREPRPIVPHTALKWKPPAPAPADTVVAESAQPDVSQDDSATGTKTVADTIAAGSDTTAVAAARSSAPPTLVELGDLSAEEPLEVGGYELTLENPYEGSILSYRHDPGVPLLYIAIIAFILGLSIRTYWPSYRVSLWVEDAPGGGVGRLTLRATGMLGEPEEIEDRLAEELAG